MKKDKQLTSKKRFLKFSQFLIPPPPLDSPCISLRHHKNYYFPCFFPVFPGLPGQCKKTPEIWLHKVSFSGMFSNSQILSGWHLLKTELQFEYVNSIISVFFCIGGKFLKLLERQFIKCTFFLLQDYWPISKFYLTFN